MILKRTLALVLIATISAQIGAYPVEKDCTGCTPKQRHPLFIQAKNERKNFNAELIHCRENNNCDEHEGFNTSLLNLLILKLRLTKLAITLEKGTEGVCNAYEKNKTDKHLNTIAELIKDTPEAQNILEKGMVIAATAVKIELNKAQ